MSSLSDYGATIVSEVSLYALSVVCSLETYRSVALLLTVSLLVYFEALLLFFFTTRIEVRIQPSITP